MTKKIFILSFIMFLIFSGFSQKNKENNMMNIKWGKKSHVIYCSDFRITKPLKEIAAEHYFSGEKSYSFTEYPDEEGRPIQTFEYTVEKDGAKYGNEPSLIQHDFGKSKSGKALLQNWAGQTASGFRPFDPTGAAGINYYIQMINSTTYTIYNKADGTVALSGTLGDLWSPSTGDAGDPIVLYDKEAGRWFLAQFGTKTDKKIYIAISQTGDPTGTWYTYTFTSPDFPDYLKFSAWKDGYYMTANYTQKIFAFNRDKMLAGDGTAEAVYQSFSPPESGFFVPLSADASDGIMPGTGTSCPVFSYSDDGWGGGNIDAVNIYNASVDWGTLDMTVTSAGAIPTDAFDASYDSNWDDIPQPGTSQKLDGIGGCLMYRAQWKKWTGYNSVVLSWAVKVSADQRGIFWCELRQNQTDDTWSMYQQGIYAPGTDYYWMSSAAMNDMGDIALCYAKANRTGTYMSLAYTGRKAIDALGTMTLNEVVVKAGGGSQTSSNRNGDYAQTCVDPDGITFWHTGEYMQAGGAAGTQVYSFQISDTINPVLSAQGINTTQINLSWNLNLNNEPALIAWSSDGTFGTPVDGTIYNPGDNIPGGGIVLSYGTSPTTYNHTGLTAATTYYYRAWSYQTDNTYTGGITTQTSTFSGNPENLSASGISFSEIDLSWNLNTEADNVLLVWSSDGTFGTPVDGTTYNFGDVIPGGGTVLSSGNQTSYNHTSLNASTHYYYKAWSNINGTSYSPGVTTDASTFCGVTTSFPVTEDFEGGILPDCWSYEGTSWTYENGGHSGYPASAHSGSFNALFYNPSNTADVSKLISPPLDMSSLAGAQLTFWHTQAVWFGDQDELRVYYKTSTSDSWTLLKTYTNNTETWTQETINLPNLNNTYYIAFEATGQYGYGVTIDDVEIKEAATSSVNEINSKNSINIFPNPNNGTFSLMLNHNFSDAKMQITDMSGKIILEKSDLNKGINTINLTNVSKGIYFIYINYDNNRIISKLTVN